MFVSNSDNLGATLDLKILTHFANNELPFMMECCKRTENDKKGGHLAIRNSDKHLVLRESAMCADEDEDFFQDITKHRFFNTNNLWIRLDKLQEVSEKLDGCIPALCRCLFRRVSSCHAISFHFVGSQSSSSLSVAS